MENTQTRILFNSFKKNEDYTEKIERLVAKNKLDVGVGISLETIQSYLKEGNIEKASERYENASPEVQRYFKDMLEASGLWRK